MCILVLHYTDVHFAISGDGTSKLYICNAERIYLVNH